MVVLYIIILLSSLRRAIGGLICTKERRSINERFEFFLLSIFARTFTKVEVYFLCFFFFVFLVSSKSQFFFQQKKAPVGVTSLITFFSFCSFCFLSWEVLKLLTAYTFIKFPPIENKQYTDIHGLIFDKNETSVTPELRLVSMSLSLRQGVKIYKVKRLSLTILMKFFHLINVHAYNPSEEDIRTKRRYRCFRSGQRCRLCPHHVDLKKYVNIHKDDIWNIWQTLSRISPENCMK